MRRQNLDNGGWFDISNAEEFEEDTNWNGNNHISVNSGSQWEHEKLYLTKKKRWVLHSWSQYQGSRETWEEITEEEAWAWLLKNSFSNWLDNNQASYLEKTEV